MLRGTTLLPGFHPGALMRNVHIRHILPPSSSDYLPGKIVDPRKQKTTLQPSDMQLRCEIQRLPFPKGLPPMILSLFGQSQMLTVHLLCLSNFLWHLFYHVGRKSARISFK